MKRTERQKQAWRKWYYEHIEEERQRSREYERTHPEIIKACRERFNERHAAEIKEKYYANKPPCPGCGRPHSPQAKLCRSCQAKLRTGANSSNWKGGRTIQSGGYVCIYKPDHPRATKKAGRYVFEHTLVWEQAHGKPLPKSWVVHHINGIRADNRPENLFGMPRKTHPNRTLIPILQARIRELEQLHLPF